LIPVLSIARQLLLAATKGDEEVQWALGTTIRQAHVQCLLAPLGRFLTEIACRAMVDIKC
jgi:hypothetical protein